VASPPALCTYVVYELDLYEEAAVKGILRWCLAISGCGFRRTSSPADPQSGASNSDSR
jgi:hypothetical protein